MWQLRAHSHTTCIEGLCETQPQKHTRGDGVKAGTTASTTTGPCFSAGALKEPVAAPTMTPTATAKEPTTVAVAAVTVAATTSVAVAAVTVAATTKEPTTVAVAAVAVTIAAVAAGGAGQRHQHAFHNHHRILHLLVYVLNRYQCRHHHH